MLFFHLKRTGTDSIRLLIEAYGEHTPTKKKQVQMFEKC